MNDFQKLLQDISAQFPTTLAMAKAIGVNASRLSRALNGDSYPFDALRCLRMAHATGRNATQILRAAGKGELADLIERLYGDASKKSMNAEQSALLENFNRADRQSQHALLTLAQNVQKEPQSQRTGEANEPTKKRRRVG